MTDFERESVWRILSNNNFTISSNNSDFQCIICHKIMINSHNSPCGCRFCLTCIKNYLGDGDKFCPGDGEDCKQQLIKIDKNVLVDHPINRKICKLIVKCPQNSCNVKEELRNMENHMRLCHCLSVDCPFFSIGCQEKKYTIEELKEHNVVNSDIHTRLLADCINNLQNDMAAIINENQLLKQTNQQLKQQIQEILLIKDDQRIDNLKNIINNLSLSTTNLNEKVESLTKVDLELKTFINDLERNMNMKFQKTTRKIDELQQLSQQITNEKKLCGESEESVNKTNDIQEKVNLIMEKLNNIDKQISNQTFGEIVWTINKWNNKMKQAEMKIEKTIYSDPFYSHRNGYKLCMKIEPIGFTKNNGTHLNLFYHIMRGSFDNVLRWPFRKDIKFELIDQDTGEVHTSKSLRCKDCPFERNTRPTQERNEIGSGISFISLNELSNNPSLTKNDQICIRCSILKT